MDRTIAALRIGFRRLTSTPTFTAAAFATVGLAVGAVTAAFGVAHTLLIEALPYPDSHELIEIGYSVPGYGFDELPLSVGTFVHTEREQGSLSDFAIYYDSDRYNVGARDPERLAVARVTPGFFGVFRSPPALGRAFNEGDRRVGAPRVAIVSHALWRRRWGGDPELVGRTIQIEGVETEVVGVAPEGFHYPDRLTALWIPLTIDETNLLPASFGYPGVARLAAGVSMDAADADIRRITRQMSDVYPDRLSAAWVERGRFDSFVRPLIDEVVGDVRTEVWLVFGTAALLLLLAMATLANLFLVRVLGRSRELAVREALGSGRARLLMDQLGESLAVAVAGGLAGLALAAFLLGVVARVAPPDLPRVAEIGMDVPTALFGLSSAFLAGVVCALLPLIARGRPRIADALQAGGRYLAGGGARGRLRHVLVAAQLAVAVALLVGAGLLVRSFLNLVSVDAGFEPRGVVTFEAGLPAEEYGPEARARAWQRLADRIAENDAVDGVGGAEFRPLSDDFRRGPLHVEGREPPEGEPGPVVDLKRVTPGYFEAMGIPLVDGRDLTREDGPGGFPAVVANQVLVDRHLDQGPALGRKVRLTARGEYAEIVGVVGNVRTESFDEEPGPHLYFPPGTTTPSSPNVPPAMTFAVRSEASPERLLPALKEAVAEVDPRLPLGSFRSLGSIVDEHMARFRLIALVLLMMAATGLVLAAAGVYGVIAYVAARRRREIGIRIALGATPGAVLWPFLLRAAALALTGAAAGALAAWMGSRLLRGVLFGVAPGDPGTYSLVVALVTGTALLASLAPSWRAARADAGEILRVG